MKRSIRIRLLVWITVLLVPMSAAAGVLLVQVFANRLLRDVDVALEEEAETVAMLLERASGPESTAALLANIAAETDLGTRKRIVVTRRGELVAEAPAGAQRSVASRQDPAFRVATCQAGAAPDVVTVTIGVYATAALHARRRLVALLEVGIPSALLLLGVGLWTVIGRALRPLEDAGRQLTAISAENLSARVHVVNPDDEVGRMVTVLNGLLDRLERVVAELQRFTADAAHELRTPLSVLRTGLDLALARERSASEYRAALEDALAGTERLGRLTDDLLALARVDAGVDPESRRVSLDLAEMLQELADAWIPTCALRDIHVRVDAPEGVTVCGNPGELYRVFNNLIDNAVGHSPGGGQVRLTAEIVGASVRVSVADDGPGIGKEESARVFDRFYRGSTARATRMGSGLGLSIARKIVEVHGGRIAIVSAPSQGCTIEVALPRA